MSEKTRCKKLLIDRIKEYSNMAAISAVSANIRAGQGTKIPVLKKSMIPVLKKTKVSSKELSPVLPIMLGKSTCAKCETTNKENMVECRLCVRWFHYTCESLELFQLEFLAKNKDKVPYACIECCSFMDSFLGKVSRERHESLKEVV